MLDLKFKIIYFTKQAADCKNFIFSRLGIFFNNLIKNNVESLFEKKNRLFFYF